MSEREALVLTPANCPNCRKSMKGDRIPERDRKFYAGATHFTLVKGRFNPATEQYESMSCPFCKATWPPKDRRNK